PVGHRRWLNTGVRSRSVVVWQTSAHPPRSCCLFKEEHMNDPHGISWSGARGISWCGARGVTGRAVAAAGALALVAPLMTGALKAPSIHTANPASELVSVIVRDVPGAAGQAEQAVRHLGGAVGRHIGIIDGFTATVPADQVSRLQQEPGVQSVSPNHA